MVVPLILPQDTIIYVSDTPVGEFILLNWLGEIVWMKVGEPNYLIFNGIDGIFCNQIVFFSQANQLGLPEKVELYFNTPHKYEGDVLLWLLY